MADGKLKMQVSTREAAGCLLCYDEACTRACPQGIEVAGIIRSIRFENTAGAASKLSSKTSCNRCEEKNCMQACRKARIDHPVDIPQIINFVQEVQAVEKTEVNLSIDFCGIPCENPFFLSSSVVGSNYEMVAKAFDMGWSGVAFKTIGTFVPKEVSPRFDMLEKEGLSFVGFKNIEQISDHTLQENLGYLHDLKKNYPTKIIVASIMGQNAEEWTYLAKKVTEAGADIIECNYSCPHMTGEGLGCDVGTNPELVAKYTAAVRAGTNLPILAKMTPNIGNMEIPAIAAVEAGADGIAAINTIKSIMNVNLESFSTGPDVAGQSSVGGYSGKAIKPIALRYIHDLKKCPQISHIPISGMGGIESWKDAVEFLALGCENLQITTAVMQYGYRIIDDLILGLQTYLQAHGYRHVSEIVGKALPNIISADDLERDSISFPKFLTHDCIGCGRCYLSCYDGGHQAIVMRDGYPRLLGRNCAGCHLCRTVCPMGAIVPGKRVKKIG